MRAPLLRQLTSFVSAVAVAGVATSASGTAETRARVVAAAHSPQAPATILFENPLTQGFAVPDGPCPSSHGDGGLILTNNSSAACSQMFNGAGPFSGDVRIEVTARLRGSAKDQNFEFGLIFGDNGAADSDRVLYSFMIIGTGEYLLTRLANMKWEYLIQPSANPAVSLGSGRANRLAVEIRGTKIQMFVNDTALGLVDSERLHHNGSRSLRSMKRRTTR